MTHSGGSALALRCGFLGWCWRRFGNRTQGAVKRLCAFVGTDLARFIYELLALGSRFVSGSLFGHCHFLFLAGAFLALFFAALFFAGLGFAFGTEGSGIRSVV